MMDVRTHACGRLVDNHRMYTKTRVTSSASLAKLIKPYAIKTTQVVEQLMIVLARLLV